MSDRDTFGPRLRAERERRGISIDTIASVTKVGGDLWEGLERNDFSRWPSGIFARAFVRDYARAIGLDSDEVVDEFCRLFPLGDRRVSRLIQAQAQLIGHPLTYSESGAVPVDGDRRTVAPPSDESLAVRARIVSRSLATVLDAVVSLVAIAVLLLNHKWFYHRVNWQENLSDLHNRKKSILAGASIGVLSAQANALNALGFSSV